MKRFFSWAFMLTVLLCTNVAYGQCGVYGDGATAGGLPLAQCGLPTTYVVSGCPCSTNQGWNVQFNNYPIATTFLPLPFSAFGMSGTINSMSTTSITITWDCLPCPPSGVGWLTAEIFPDCSPTANEVIRIECIPDTVGSGGNDSCEVVVSEYTCLKFHKSLGNGPCCTCVRIEFVDGTVLYDIISASTNNDATLCYQQMISGYTVSSIPCDEWCDPNNTSGNTEPDLKTSGQSQGGVEPTSTGLKLYPNPASGSQVSAKYNSSGNQTLRYEIADMNGRVLMSGELDANSGENSWEINCESCKSKQPYNFILLDKNYKVLESKMLLLNF